MKVAIFETEHFEAAYPLVRLFDNGHNELTLFSYPPAEHQLKYMLKEDLAKYQWITKRENQSKVSFVFTLYREVKNRKIELLYLNTVGDNHLLYALLVRLLPKVRVIMTVHAINAFFTTKRKFIPRRMLSAWGKSQLRKAVKEFNVLSEAMAPVLRQRLPAGKKVHVVPGAVYEEGNASPRLLQNPVRIVVPGSIDGRRRDYLQVFELLMLLQKEDIPIVITLAGTFYSHYGEKILNKCRQWSAKDQQLIYFEKGPVDQPEFDKILMEADLVFTPSVVNTMIEEGVEETYGLTISSGNVSDVIRFSKPFIIPPSLVVDTALEKSCLRYSSVKDIVDFLLLTHEDTWIYTNLLHGAKEASKEYTIGKIWERNKDL